MPGRATLPASLREEMPPPTAELTLIGVLMRAHLKTLSPKKRRAYLITVMDSLTEFEEMRKVVRLRGREHDEAVSETHRQATAWTRGMMSAFLVHDADAPPR